MKTFIEFFSTILAGDKESSRQSARGVRKFLYGSYQKSKYDDVQLIIETAPSKYVEIQEGWRQENFVLSVSVIYFLHHNQKSPDFLYPWIFSLLQHDNGNIRYAALRMIKNDLGPLTVHIRCPDLALDDKLAPPNDADDILLSIYMNLYNLSVFLSNPSYKKYKYIDSLPSSPYKTVEMLLVDMEDLCGKAYMKQLSDRLLVLAR